MQYDHFVTSDRVNRYPAYMDKEMRLVLRQKMKEENLSMYCSCSFYSSIKLAYGISVDGKIYPLHQGYEHHPQCIRNISPNKRTSAYMVQEDGSAKAYMSFKLENFTVPSSKKNETKSGECSSSKIFDTEEDEKEKKDGKEPTNTLSKFVVALNTDTYHERLTNGKGLISADYFLSAIHARLKKTYIDGYEKPLRDMSLKEDNLQFFYQPLVSVSEDGNKIVLKGYHKDFSHFIYYSTLAKEKLLFEEKYGITVEEALTEQKRFRVMAAGFLYLRTSRNDKLYKAIGRIHLFLVNENGLYCRDMGEVEELNAVSLYLKTNKRYQTIQFDRVITDPKIWGIFSREGKKQVIVCKPKVPLRIEKEGPDHIAIGTEGFSKEAFAGIDKVLIE